MLELIHVTPLCNNMEIEKENVEMSLLGCQHKIHTVLRVTIL